jgi:hypothetical protein
MPQPGNKAREDAALTVVIGAQVLTAQVAHLLTHRSHLGTIPMISSDNASLLAQCTLVSSPARQP